MQAYKQAIRLEPNRSGGAYSGLGDIYIVLGSYKKAIDSFKEVIKLSPNSGHAHYGLGVAYLAIGDRASALSEHKILQGLDPKLAKELLTRLYK